MTVRKNPAGAYVKERYFITATIAIVPGITAERIRECLREAVEIKLPRDTMGTILTVLEKEGVIRTRWGGNRHGPWRKCWLTNEE